MTNNLPKTTTFEIPEKYIGEWEGNSISTANINNLTIKKRKQIFNITGDIKKSSVILNVGYQSKIQTRQLDENNDQEYRIIDEKIKKKFQSKYTFNSGNNKVDIKYVNTIDYYEPSSEEIDDKQHYFIKIINGRTFELLFFVFYGSSNLDSNVFLIFHKNNKLYILSNLDGYGSQEDLMELLIPESNYIPQYIEDILLNIDYYEPIGINPIIVTILNKKDNGDNTINENPKNDITNKDITSKDSKEDKNKNNILTIVIVIFVLILLFVIINKKK